MSEASRWEAWLAEADSVGVLAPVDYDDDAALARVKALYQRLRQALPEYKVSAASTELYQDGTGMAQYRVTSPSQPKPFDPTLAFVILSHFGNLATIRKCNDPQLLGRIRRTLHDFGLRYIDYDYLAARTYNGKCEALAGRTLADRYFALVI